MKAISLTAVAVAMLLAIAAAPAHAQAPAKTPTQAYLDFVAAASTAKSLSNVYPFIIAEWRRNLEGLSKDRQPRFLESFNDAGKRRDLKITKETVNGTVCILEGTAKNQDGAPMKGKVKLVKEGGAWKVSDDAWGTTGEPPAK